MKALIFVADGVEDMEFFYPYYRFKEQKINIDVAGRHSGVVATGKHGYKVVANMAIEATKHEDYDIVILPGGKAPEELRGHPTVIDTVRKMFEEGKIVASICHGAQILVSADILEGKTATCYKSIKDDIIAAGAEYKDQSVVVDGNLITSRNPDDLPDFCREIFNAINAPVGR